jgi:endoplasmic reticulum-Golgi intermediate compartment protein 2
MIANFPQAKSKPQYVTRTSGGGKWTVGMLIISLLLVASEFSHWWRGHEEHTFAVEKGVGHDLQINMDIVVKMSCADLHINVQDAAGDRILAAEMLKREPTNWDLWATSDGIHRLGRDRHGKVITGVGWQSVEHDEGFGQEHVHDIVAQAVRKNKWAKTPRLRGLADSCRIFGSLSVNKVMGDFHITARGHGYQEFGQAPVHLDHSGMCTRQFRSITHLIGINIRIQHSTSPT